MFSVQFTSSSATHHFLSSTTRARVFSDLSSHFISAYIYARYSDVIINQQNLMTFLLLSLLFMLANCNLTMIMSMNLGDTGFPLYDFTCTSESTSHLLTSPDNFTIQQYDQVCNMTQHFRNLTEENQITNFHTYIEDISYIDETFTNKTLSIELFDSSDVKLKFDGTNYGNVLRGKHDFRETQPLIEECFCRLRGGIELLATYITPNFTYVANLVSFKVEDEEEAFREDKFENRPPSPSPEYFWSYVELGIDKVSIIETTQAYLRKLEKLNASQIDENITNNSVWSAVLEVCKKLALDEKQIFTRLEHLNRYSAVSFFTSLMWRMHHFEDVQQVMFASRSCKLLHLHGKALSNKYPFLNSAKKENDIGADTNSTSEISAQQNEEELKYFYEFNNVTNETRLNDKQLAKKCPIMKTSDSKELDLWRTRFNVNVKIDFKKQYTNLSKQLQSEFLRIKQDERAILCAKQLLYRNDIWLEINNNAYVIYLVNAVKSWLSKADPIDIASATYPQAMKAKLNKIVEELSINKLVELAQQQKQKLNDTSMDESSRYTQNGDITNIIDIDTDKFKHIFERACNIIANFDGVNMDFENQLQLVRSLVNFNQLAKNEDMFLFYVTNSNENLFRLYACYKLCLRLKQDKNKRAV